MRLLTAAWFRLRAIVHGKRLNAEFEDELRAHIVHETQANIERGMSAEEARQLALSQFGGVERFKEELRDERSMRWLLDGVSDMRYAARRLRRSPLFTSAVVGTLALGIGATSTIFTIVNGVLLRPLPFPNADRLVTVAEYVSGEGGSVNRAIYAEWRDSLQFFDDIAGYNASSVVLTGAGEPVHVRGSTTTASFFHVLGAIPALGRTYDASAEEPGSDKLVVLSNALWRSNFGADSSVIGRSVLMDGISRTVVAVMKPGFDFPSKATYWIPLPKMVSGVPSRRFMSSIGLLSHEATFTAAASFLQKNVSANDLTLPVRQRGRVIQLKSLHDSLFGSVRKPLALLFGAVCLLLLVGCGNIAGLTMAQAVQRKREFGVRLALGASRWRLVRQLLIESALLAVVGGTLGTVIPLVLVPAIVHLSPASVAGVQNIRVDGGVLLFTAAATVGVLLIAGLWPAISATRSNQTGSISSLSTRATGSRRQQITRSALVVGQVCAALVLVTGAGMLTRSFTNAMSVDTGIDATNVMAAIVQLPMSRYGTAQQVRAFHEQMAEATRGLPGVTDVSLSDGLPLFYYQYAAQIKRSPDDGRTSAVVINQVDAQYRDVLNLRLMRGRFIASADNAGAQRVAVLTESAARALFPNGDALGREVNASFTPDSVRPVVVGVVADVVQESLEQKAMPELFLSIAQQDAWPAFMSVRTSAGRESFQRALTEIVHSIDPLQPLTRLESLEERRNILFAPRRFSSLLIDTFAVLALGLSMIGLYALMAQSVASRTRELGIRMALGAQQASVLSLVLQRGLVVAASGIMIGFVLSIAASRVFSNQLFGVTPTDPLIHGAAIVSLAIIALVACYIPARRATRVDPTLALRQE